MTDAAKSLTGTSTSTSSNSNSMSSNNVELYNL